MKRKANIETEIDCNKETCGKCEYATMDYRYISYCALFCSNGKCLRFDGISYFRCQKCLDTFGGK